jgi:putative spermidine/putrescine transport system permease protein
MKQPAFRIWWLALPALGYLLVAYAAPLAWLLMRSVMRPESFSLVLFVTFLSDDYNLRVIGNTLRIALLVTLLCLVIGYPVALALARARGIAQVLLLTAIILPLSIGVVVKAFAWQIVLRRDGAIAKLLVWTGIWDEPQRLLFTEPGLVIGAANVFLPFMILPIYSVVRLIDPRLAEAGATLGASPFHRFRKIILPLTMPGLITGMAFVFSMSLSMFVIPSLLMGDRFQTLATLTGRSFLLMRDEALGSATAVVLLVLAVTVVVGSTWVSRRLARGG